MIEIFKSLGLITRLGIAAGLTAAIVGSCALRDASLRREGAAAVVDDSKKEGKKNAQQATKAHEKARQPGAADRLRRDACRDC